MLYEIAWPLQDSKEIENSKELSVKFAGTSVDVFVKLNFQASADPSFILYCAEYFDGTNISVPSKGQI